MSKLGKLVLILILVIIISFTVAIIALSQSEALITYIDDNFDGSVSEISILNWIWMFDGKRDVELIVGPQKTFDVNESTEFFIEEDIRVIEVNSTIADIIVETAGDGKASVELSGEVSYGGDNQPELKMTVDDGRVEIEVFYNKNNLINASSENLKLQVFLPESYQGIIDIYSISGNVYVNHLKSEHLVGESISGNLEINDVDTNELNLQTVSGEILVNQNKIEGDYQLDSISGNININVREMSDIKFDFSSISGTGAYLYVFDTVVKEKENNMELIRGLGTYEVRIKTTSGNATLQFSE